MSDLDLARPGTPLIAWATLATGALAAAASITAIIWAASLGALN